MALLDARHQRLAEWSAAPAPMREPSTQQALAAEFGVNERTLRRWAELPDVMAETTRLIQQTAGAPEKLAAIYDALFKAATEADERGKIDVTAAKLYFTATGIVQQAAAQITVNTGSAKDLTDEELSAALSLRLDASKV